MQRCNALARGKNRINREDKMTYTCKHEFKDGKMVIPKPVISPEELNMIYERLTKMMRERGYEKI